MFPIINNGINIATGPKFPYAATVSTRISFQFAPVSIMKTLIKEVAIF